MTCERCDDKKEIVHGFGLLLPCPNCNPENFFKAFCEQYYKPITEHPDVQRLISQIMVLQQENKRVNPELLILLQDNLWVHLGKGDRDGGFFRSGE